MPIGTSHGAFHEDEFRLEAHPWFVDPKDDMEKKPEDVDTDKQLDKVEQREIGIEI